LSRTTGVSRYQKGKTNLDFTEARDSEWQWHQLGHMQVCTSLQTVNHASPHHSVILQAGCPSCRPTNSISRSLKAVLCETVRYTATNISCCRWTRATCCFARIVLCTAMDAQCELHGQAELVGRTSTVASIVNLVPPTTVQFICAPVMVSMLRRVRNCRFIIIIIIF